MSKNSLASPAGDEPRAETPPSDFSIIPYREQGQLWTWTSFSAKPRFKSTKNTIRGLSCYQYAPKLIDSNISKVVELTEEDLEAWLKTPAPLKDEKKHCGGYQILQINNEYNPETIPLKIESFEAVNKSFGIPPVQLHHATAVQGACGMFLQDDGSFGLDPTPYFRN